MYIESVKRLQTLEGIEVNIPNHGSMGKVFERAERLAERVPGPAHPFAAPEEFCVWLDEVLANGERKLEQEKARASR